MSAASNLTILQALAALGPQVSQMGPAAQVQNVNFSQPQSAGTSGIASAMLGQGQQTPTTGPLLNAQMAYLNTQNRR
ncbi:unnamed protein product, partial [marine sediment metagenome]